MVNPPPKMSLQAPAPPNQEQPLLVFLPGMDGTGLSLNKQLLKLQRYFDVRYLAIPFDERSTSDKFLDHVIDLISPIASAQRPLYLCGESFGGCLALKIAAREPNLASRLILINPASNFQSYPVYQWASNFLPLIPKVFFLPATIGLFPFLINFNRVPAQTRAELLKCMQQVTPQSASQRLSILRQWSLDAMTLRQISVPTLILASQKDQLLGSVKEARRLIQLLPNAQQMLLPESGHACLLESSVNLVTLLKSQDFLPKPKTVYQF